MSDLVNRVAGGFSPPSRHSDGSWGRFHTENTKRKQGIHTTQFAINRATELGVDRQDALLTAAIHYISL